ncbi:MAG: PAS domain-containing protein [Lachnospiraceae bacterium]|nr:PAS domain-containing protein [Lachnospiraceae bacterium]
MAANTSRRERYSDDFSLTKYTLPVVWQMSSVIPGGFFIYKEDEKRELIYANQRVCDIYGCKDIDEFKELTGFTFNGMVHPDDFHLIQGSIDSQIDSDEGDSFDHVEYRIIRKDGEIRWVDDYGHFGYSPEYGDLYYVFISDITKQKTELISKEKYEHLEAAADKLVSSLEGALLSEDAKAAIDEIKKMK